ncbi:hypothetical protein SEA_BOLT007_10 [Arthrobacter phage Bolt007]|uniref:Uncharacterized protein n=1 Tax=Arthrobacter phage Bolt007 TaxID=3017297 RepID=A0AA49E4D6_9CAUD|nr:hypothetical protein SEA_BOLT007_10 [Arthrobacter phage Bolt007]
MTDPSEYGVSVETVSALAPHVTISADPDPLPGADPLYSNSGIRKITAEAVERWIEGVTARVTGRLYRLAELPAEHAARPGIEAEIADAINNGAAAYLVDAAFPAKAAPNDNTSYGEVLRARSEAITLELMERIVAIVDAPVVVGAPGPVAISFEFPPATFTDGFRV